MSDVTNQSLCVHTVGHSARPLDDFIALLQTYRITLLIDVRKMPRSRTNPQFNIDTLPAQLARVGIGYQHLPGLGGLRRPRPDSPNGGWRNRSFQAYADYMQTPEFEENLEIVLAAARHGAVALMCAEAVPWRCHRSLIGDALVVRGVRVEDILSRTRAQKHVLSPWAHVEGTTITYPPAAADAPVLHPEPDPMTRDFNVGDHVRWNSEAGIVSGVIKKKVTRPTQFKGYTRHASKEEPQYLIQSDKTDHQAMHKGSALRKIPKRKK
jgi:Domain of unknown function DUF488/Hypervirulence associated proteins TUDOR domain